LATALLSTHPDFLLWRQRVHAVADQLQSLLTRYRAMLGLALPLFIVPRIVTTHLSHRLSGRTLLTAGLALVFVAAFITWCLVRASDTPPISRLR
jgi:small neutral amino acid transporter SnatA (MarC family)